MYPGVVVFFFLRKIRVAYSLCARWFVGSCKYASLCAGTPLHRSCSMYEDRSLFHCLFSEPVSDPPFASMSPRIIVNLAHPPSSPPVLALPRFASPTGCCIVCLSFSFCFAGHPCTVPPKHPKIDTRNRHITICCSEHEHTLL